MENLQESAFLTGVGLANKHHDQTAKKKLQANTLKHNIKTIVGHLPGQELVNQVLANLGLSKTIIELCKNIEKQKDIGISQLKKIFYQLKMIQKETLRLKNNSNFQNIKNNIQPLKSPKINQQHSTMASYNRSSLAKSSQSNRNSLHQNKQQMMKIEIQRELSYRKFIKQLKFQNFREKKGKYLFTKINNAKMLNKKSQKIHNQMCQKQKSKQQQMFNRIKNEACQDYSIWAQKSSTRIAVTSKQKFRIQCETLNNQSPRSKFLIYDKSGMSSQRQTSVTKKRKESMTCKNSWIDRSNKHVIFKDNSTLNMVDCQDKFLEVINRKKILDQSKFSEAICRVVKKNFIIESIHRSKNHTANLQQSKSVSGIVHKQNTDFRNIGSEERQSKIKNKVYQTIRKKQDIVKQKSQQIRQRLIKSRDRFLRRKNQIDKQNYQKIQRNIQTEIQIKQVLKQRRLKQQRKMQKVIKKKVQQSEHRQTLSEQLMSLKKKSDVFLQKKLSQLEMDKFSNSICSTWAIA